MSAANTSERLMTKSGYAEHRGVSPSLITQWRKADRLVMVGKRVDAVASDALLARSLDQARGGRGGKAARVPDKVVAEAPSPDPADESSDTASFQAHRARREGFAAKQTELAYRKAVGEVVEWARTEPAVVAIYSTLRRSVQRIPDALSARLAAEPDPRKVRAMLSTELEQALSDMADAVAALPQQLKAAAHV